MFRIEVSLNLFPCMNMQQETHYMQQHARCTYKEEPIKNIGIHIPSLTQLGIGTTSMHNSPCK